MPSIRLTRSILATVAAGGAALALAAYFALRGTVVDVAQVESTRITQSVVVSGRVLAPAKADIGAAITGRVQADAADEGDHVAAGALLVELEQAELASALAQARAAEAAAQTRIQQWREVGAPNAAQLLAQAEAKPARRRARRRAPGAAVQAGLHRRSARRRVATRGGRREEPARVREVDGDRLRRRGRRAQAARGPAGAGARRARSRGGQARADDHPRVVPGTVLDARGRTRRHRAARASA